MKSFWELNANDDVVESSSELDDLSPTSHLRDHTCFSIHCHHRSGVCVLVLSSGNCLKS